MGKIGEIGLCNANFNGKPARVIFLVQWCSLNVMTLKYG